MIITTFNQSSEQALKNCPALLTIKRFLILSFDDGVHLYLGILIPTLDLNARFLGFETRAGHDEKKLHFFLFTASGSSFNGPHVEITKATR